MLLKDNLFKDKTILVAGGTGSFGNQIVEKLIPYNPKQIRIFSRDEDKQFNMSIKLNMVHQYPQSNNIRFKLITL